MPQLQVEDFVGSDNLARKFFDTKGKRCNPRQELSRSTLKTPQKVTPSNPYPLEPNRKFTHLILFVQRSG
jgi:hypothetical protein